MMKSKLENSLIRKDDFLEIPHKLLVFISKGKTNYTYPVIYPVDVDKLDKNKKNRIYNNTLYRNFWGDKTDNAESVIIPNTGFSLELDDPYYSTFYSKGHLVTNIVVRHPDLEKYGKLYVPTPVQDIFKFAKEQGILGGKVIGTYCIRTEKYFSGFGGARFVLEDKSEKVEDGKRFSEERYKQPFTIKWKPGYIYTLENDYSVLYLGKLRNAKTCSYDWETCCGGKEIFNHKYTMGYSNLKRIDYSVPVIIRLNHNEVLKFIQNTKSTSISDFLIEFLNYSKQYKENNPMVSGIGIEKFNTKKKRGIEVEKLLDDDGFDISKIISDFCTKNIYDPGYKNSKNRDVTEIQCGLLLGILPEDITPEVKSTIITYFSYISIAEILNINSRYGKKINVFEKTLSTEMTNRMPHLVTSFYTILGDKSPETLEAICNKIREIWRIEKL